MNDKGSAWSLVACWHFARQQVLEPRTVDLSELIGGTYERLRRTLTGDVRSGASPRLACRIDPGQLEKRRPRL